MWTKNDLGSKFWKKEKKGMIILNINYKIDLKSTIIAETIGFGCAFISTK